MENNERKQDDVNVDALTPDEVALNDPETQVEYTQRYREQLSRLSCYGCGEEPL